MHSNHLARDAAFFLLACVVVITPLFLFGGKGDEAPSKEPPRIEAPPKFLPRKKAASKPLTPAPTAVSSQEQRAGPPPTDEAVLDFVKWTLYRPESFELIQIKPPQFGESGGNAVWESRVVYKAQDVNGDWATETIYVYTKFGRQLETYLTE